MVSVSRTKAKQAILPRTEECEFIPSSINNRLREKIIDVLLLAQMGVLLVLLLVAWGLLVR